MSAVASLLCDYHDLSMREARPMLLSAELGLKVSLNPLMIPSGISMLYLEN